MKRIVMGKDALVDGLWSRGVIGDRTKAFTTIERLSADTRDCFLLLYSFVTYINLIYHYKLY